MTDSVHVSPDEIRTLFSTAMSEMYRAEVPQYGALLELVAEVNRETLERNPDLRASLERADELDRLSVERHGAIRLGSAQELATIRRLFGVMGMAPVGYYDLSVAGVPVHSTAFRPVTDESLRRNPFRVFTSLLRLELIENDALRAEAAAVLAARKIFTDGALELIETSERSGGLNRREAEGFVKEALETFRWHSRATVSAEVYQRLHQAHRLIADVVSFKGPHINHLTPRTLDIDIVQTRMPLKGMTPKAVIEGPPRRKAAILLRQTSFKALEEPIAFANSDGIETAGTHTARFGEIEQRGAALTPAGRKLYDELLASVRQEVQVTASGAQANDYRAELEARFQALPDDLSKLRTEKLAFFRYTPTRKGIEAAEKRGVSGSLNDLIQQGYVCFDPIVYEDFLPVSAAGIFQSNLGSDAQQNYGERANRSAFEEALGQPVLNELDLYAEAESGSIRRTLATLALGSSPNITEKSPALSVADQS